MVPHGVFVTRAPQRPNAIGLSIVRLVAVNGDEMIIDDADILNGTPLSGIKPCVPAFDCFPDEATGWFEGCGSAVAGAQSERRPL